jgi:sugar lactone lactonase YvrE
MPDVTCVVDCRDELGESPVWCPIDKRLYWLDIKGQTISWFTPATGEHKVVKVDEQPGSLVLREKGGMVVAFYGGFRFFDPETGAVETIHEVEADVPESRMNDGRCDRQGRFWAGSMDDAMTGRPLGALYRLDPDLSLHQIEPEIIISNSIAFSPDGTTMYFADFGRDTIWAYDLDVGSGTVSNKRVFAGPKSAPGFPDGSTVDSDGYLWNARWDGWCVARFAPDGTLVNTIEVPFQQVTCPMFGGDNLEVLYVTGAKVNLPADALAKQEQAGSVFAITGSGCRGLPEPRFKG